MKRIGIGAWLLFDLALAYAGSAPLWTFTPLTPTSFVLAENNSAVVSYKITNYSFRTHLLQVQPINGVTQTITPGNCPDPFVLSYLQSCILNLTVTGSQLSGNVVEGPLVCSEGSLTQCYQPSRADRLNITKGAKSYYTLGGTVSGLDITESLVLQNNNPSQTVTLTTNGAFTFPNAVDPGTAYNVTVLTQPPGQTCVVTSGGSGVVTSSNITNIIVNCTNNFYTVGGTIFGLNGLTTVLQNNNTNNLSLSATTPSPFTFSMPIEHGQPYNVTILTQPLPLEICTVEQGSGTIVASNITNVEVICVLDLPYVESFTGANTTLPWSIPGGWMAPPLPPGPNTACLTAGGSGSTPQPCNTGQGFLVNGLAPPVDSSPNGVLRLTQALINQEGGLILPSLFSMDQGLQIEFTAYSYGGGNGVQYADGFSFFLIDGTNPIPSVLGPYGSGLGYGNGSFYPGQGIAGGYIGVGFDEYGLFSSSNPPNLVPNSIGIRGPTASSAINGNNGLIASTGNLTTAPTSQSALYCLYNNIAFPADSCTGSTSTPRSFITVGTNNNRGFNQYKITITATGIMNVYRNNILLSFGPPVNSPNVDLNVNAGALPETVYFGFAGSTGTSINIHEISDLTVNTFP